MIPPAITDSFDQHAPALVAALREQRRDLRAIYLFGSVVTPYFPTPVTSMCASTRRIRYQK
jgi:hypothetical protein